MKKRVADIIADFFVENGLGQVFSVVGGGAMYLNDALGNKDGLKVTYTHHEQAAAIAAEAYARLAGKVAPICVTTGPGGTNALTGVLCGWQDNIPMLIVSGQVRYATTVESTGLNLRQFGEQEYTIIPTVKPMTKYAVMVREPQKILYFLQKALHIAMDGRRGPCWLDIPLDVQGAVIDTEDLEQYTPDRNSMKNNWRSGLFDEALKMLKEAKRPVILAGSAVRACGHENEFREMVDLMKVPTLAATSVADLFETEAENYYGNFGSFGGRVGNFIVQNADLIIAFGCRMTFKHVGFNYQSFSPSSQKIVIDVDANELKKDIIRIDLPINCDLKEAVDYFLAHGKDVSPQISNWVEYCNELKAHFPVYVSRFEKSKNVNPYYLYKELQNNQAETDINVVGNSVACVSVLQMGIRKRGQRLFGNANCGTMGYDLPAAVGAALAGKGEVFCITGDGSIMMNLQELQTIVHYGLAVKVIIFNNYGYQAIRQTQTNFFNGRLSGCSKESGVSMPDFEKIAGAFGFPYMKIENNADIAEKIKEFVKIKGYAICELIQDDSQGIEPRVKSKEDENGNIVSPPIDDLYPFLTEEQYKNCQYIFRGE